MDDNDIFTFSKVLICDDDSDTLSLISLILSDIGCTLIEAVDGSQAISICRSELPDVCVLDIMMPNVSGFDVVKWLREEYSEVYVPVLFLTALSDIERKIEGFDIGGNDYVVKPFNPEELRSRVRALIRIKRLTDILRSKNAELTNLNDTLQKTQESLVERERQLAAMQLAGATLHKIGQPITATLLGCYLLRQTISSSQVSNAQSTKELELVASIETECAKMRQVLKSLEKVDATNVAHYVGETDILDL